MSVFDISLSLWLPVGKIQERRGDEIMFISESSESLLATALKLQANIANEENFLQVHGALHNGKVLKRADSYYGSAINLVSRIAAKAAPGTFWCSDDFIDSIGDRSVCSFMPMGSHSFKNMARKTEVYEIQVEKSHVHAIDPVCRMIIADRKNAFYSPDYAGHYFCSTQCLVMFRKNQIYPGQPDHQSGYKMSLFLN